MKDKLHNELEVGDKVCYAPGGSYAGVSIGTITKFTPKQVGIKNISGGAGRHMTPDEDKLYYTYSNQIIKL